MQAGDIRNLLSIQLYKVKYIFLLKGTVNVAFNRHNLSFCNLSAKHEQLLASKFILTVKWSKCKSHISLEKKKVKKEKHLPLPFFSWTMVFAYSCANLDFGVLGHTGQTTILSPRRYYESNLYHLSFIITHVFEA